MLLGEAVDSGRSEIITGLFGSVTGETLESFASGGGPSMQVVRKLASAPESGNTLSVWVGEVDAALANAARTEGQVYTANIPTALVAKMESVGLLSAR